MSSTPFFLLTALSTFSRRKPLVTRGFDYEDKSMPHCYFLKQEYIIERTLRNIVNEQPSLFFTVALLLFTGRYCPVVLKRE